MLRLALTLGAAMSTCCSLAAAQSCQDFSKITQVCPVHAVGRIVPSVCDSDKDIFDNNCKAVYEKWYEKCHKTKHVSSLHKVHIGQLRELYMICQTTPTFFVRDAPLRLQKGNKLAVLKKMDDDYSISFEITPGPTLIKGWSSIIHFTATNHNYGHTGDRIPGVVRQSVLYSVCLSADTCCDGMMAVVLSKLEAPARHRWRHHPQCQRRMPDHDPAQSRT